IRVGIALANESLRNLRQLRAVFEPIGHVGAVEIRPEADVICSDELNDVINVVNDPLPADMRDLALGLQLIQARGSCRRSYCADGRRSLAPRSEMRSAAPGSPR